MKDRTVILIVVLCMFVFVAMIFLILAAIAVPNYLEARTRARVRRVQEDLREVQAAMDAYRNSNPEAFPTPANSDAEIPDKIDRVNTEMRALQTAIESYAIDTNMYPACSLNAAENFYGKYQQAAPQLANVPTFRFGGFPGLMSLTTPIAYMVSMPRDSFAPAGATYAFYSKPGLKKDSGWIMWSPGPDGKYDINSGNIEHAYMHTAETPSDLLVGLTYDPTNGTKSNGDIWRMVIEEGE